MKTSFFFFSLFLCIPGQAQECGLPYAQLAQIGYLEANFVEEKKLRLLRQPLVSRGRIRFTRKDTRAYLMREVTSPLRSSMLLTPEHITMRQGQTRETIGVRSKPTVFAFANAFLWILSGNRAALMQHFDMAVQSNAACNEMVVTLVPKHADLKSIVQQISLEIKGNALLTLTLKETNGDTTTMKMTETKRETRPLSEAQIQREFRIP